VGHGNFHGGLWGVATRLDFSGGLADERELVSVRERDERNWRSATKELGATRESIL